MQDFEKLGAFYLGRRYDVDSGETTDETLLYDAKDLTTHAVCVGMTGSGKTGLCVSLLEEAAIDGIPAIIIDPKGDMGNLMLTFPNLAAKDFEPWVDPAEAVRKGLEVPEFAAKTAATWKKGLASWGEDGDRIRRLREAAEVTIYTPGSNVGLPMTVLRSFDAPPQAVRDDLELFTDRIQASATGLLGLLGIDADPVQSREAILIANILQHAWSAGRNLSLADMIREIQAPPFDRLGVLELESFYPGKDRTALAMSLNGLLASPGFAQWMQGEPLDVGALLRTGEGKPRLSILSIAHLSESERMFFVSLLLNEVVAWMRAQSGTSSLRALLYMDEIFGYFPPSKEPPSKKPMLTLLKQARAFGLGVVLATQNPVDLDYKGLSNTGTWFIGRLQTERDKLRVLDGLEGAMTGGGKTFDRDALDATLSGLGKRVFLLNNVHEDEPVVFHTRWAMSYLRGPLSREHVRALMDPRRTELALASPATTEKLTKADRKSVAKAQSGASVAARPVVPTGVTERLAERTAALVDGQRVIYRPALVSRSKLHYVYAKANIDSWVNLATVLALRESQTQVDWSKAEHHEGGTPFSLVGGKNPSPEEGAAFASLPAIAERAKSYKTWAKELKSHLYQGRALQLWKNADYKLISKEGESEGDFRGRVVLAAHEARDLKMEKLRDRYAPKLARMKERVRKAEQKVEKEEEQYRQSKKGKWISLGTSVLGAVFGRKLASATTARRAGTTARSFGKSSKEKADVERAEDDLEVQEGKLLELEAEFKAELDELDVTLQPAEIELEEVSVRPRKGDLDVHEPELVWLPWRVSSEGIAERAY